MMFEALGLSGQDVALAAAGLGIFVATLFARRGGEAKAAREAADKPSLLTSEDLSEEMLDVKGELRQMRQELRLEAKETRAHASGDGRETRAALARILELAIVISAELRRGSRD